MVATLTYFKSLLGSCDRALGRLNGEMPQLENCGVTAIGCYRFICACSKKKTLLEERPLKNSNYSVKHWQCFGNGLNKIVQYFLFQNISYFF